MFILKLTADIVLHAHVLRLPDGLPDALAAVQMAECMLNPQLDLYIKDSPDEVGLEPNEITNHMWTSKDIWVRNQPDGKYIREHHDN